MSADEILGLAALTAALVAVIAWIADRRRLRRSNLDRVGWVPWTNLFFWALMATVILLALAIKARVGG
jgi:hypothetical protein